MRLNLMVAALALFSALLTFEAQAEAPIMELGISPEMDLVEMETAKSFQPFPIFTTGKEYLDNQHNYVSQFGGIGNQGREVVKLPIRVIIFNYEEATRFDCISTGDYLLDFIGYYEGEDYYLSVVDSSSACYSGGWANYYDGKLWEIVIPNLILNYDLRQTVRAKVGKREVDEMGYSKWKVSKVETGKSRDISMPVDLDAILAY